MNTITPSGNIPLPDGNLQNLFYPVADYTYFARAAERPFAAGNTITKAAWAADAAVLSYARRGRASMTQADFTACLTRGGLSLVEKIGDSKTHSAQGYFAAHDQFAILAFRGTDEGDPSETAADTDLLLVHEPDYRPAPLDPKPALRYFSLIEQLFAEPCLVRRGFQRELDRVWADVHGCITAYRLTQPDSEIVFTGHGLGAALAVLAISRFSDPNLSLYTLGCPRVGNQAFCDRVMQGRARDMFRCVNLNDAVAHVPLESESYRHAPRLRYRFDENGALTEDADDRFLGDTQALAASFASLPSHLGDDLELIPAPPCIVDHSPSRYCVRLWNCVS